MFVVFEKKILQFLWKGSNVLDILPWFFHKSFMEFWPIRPDRMGVNESGFKAALLTCPFLTLPTHFLW